MIKKEEVLDEIERIEWLIKIRWFVIFCILLILFIAKFYGDLNFPILPCIFIWAVAVTYNLIFSIIIIANKKFSPNNVNFIISKKFTLIRTNVDIVFITILVHLTGGVESPFVVLYLLDLLTTAMGGNLSLAFLLAGETMLLYGTLLNLEAFKIIPHISLLPATGVMHLDSGYVLTKVFSLFILGVALIFATIYLVERIRQKQTKIEELNEATTDFVNAVSHELKSPLTAIQGYDSLLLDEKAGKITGEQKDFLQKIRHQTQRITAMTSDLLNIARIESGFTHLNKTIAAPRQIVENAVEEIEPQLEEKKITLTKDVAKNLPTMNIDFDKIGEVLTNLLSNAIKFSKDNGKLFLSVQPYQDDKMKFSIKDEGIGIVKEDLEKIFNKFYRASTSAAAVKGTGLGLALCKSIVDLHNGKIWAESDGIDKGATFSFILPVK